MLILFKGGNFDIPETEIQNSQAVKIFPNIVNEAEKPVSLAKLLRFWQPLLYGLTQEFLNT